MKRLAWLMMGLFWASNVFATGILFNVMKCSPFTETEVAYQIRQMMFSAPGGPTHRTATFSFQAKDGSKLNITLPFITYVRHTESDTVIYTNHVQQDNASGFVHFYHQGERNWLQYEILVGESTFSSEGLVELNNYKCNTAEFSRE